MARTMKDKKTKAQAQTNKNKMIIPITKTIKKSDQKSPKQMIKNVKVLPKTTKKQTIASSVKTREIQGRISSAGKKKQDELNSLTSQILRRVKNEVESKVLKQIENNKNKKNIKKECKKEEDQSEQGYMSQSSSADIEKYTEQQQQQPKSSNRTIKSTTLSSKTSKKEITALPKRTKTYQKLLRSGNQFGYVQIRSNLNLEGEVQLPIPKQQASSKTMTTKQQKENEKQSLLKQSDVDDKDINYFSKPDQQIQTISYRRPNSKLIIKDESASLKETASTKGINDENNFSFQNKSTNYAELKSNLFRTPLIQQSANITMNTTTAASSRACSTSSTKEDIRTEQNARNSHRFFLKDNNKPNATSNNSEYTPLEYKKAQTVKQRNLLQNSKKSEQGMEIECMNQEVSDECSKQLVDIVFCCDTTSSMGEYLLATVDYITAIYNQTQPFQHLIDVKYAFVCYRDHPPEENTYLYRISNLSSASKTIHFIQQQDAQGGGDTPEAVMDALYVATSAINWRQTSIKYIIHIADAPPHGDLYTGINGGFLQTSFVWRDGCPCGLTIEKIAKMMNKLQIHYRLIKAGDNMERMATMFKSCIEHYADIKVDSPEGLDFILSDMVAKQCLNKLIIQNDVSFGQSNLSRTHSTSRSKHQEDVGYAAGNEIECQEDNQQITTTNNHLYKGIHRTYSNKQKALKRNNNDEYDKENLRDEKQEYNISRQNYQKYYQNNNQPIHKYSAKYTANQLSCLPINYKAFAGQTTSTDYQMDIDDMQQL